VEFHPLKYGLDRWDSKFLHELEIQNRSESFVMGLCNLDIRLQVDVFCTQFLLTRVQGREYISIG